MRVEKEDEKIVAILHDVVEDTDWTFDALREEGFSEIIIEALKSVTKHNEIDAFEAPTRIPHGTRHTGAQNASLFRLKRIVKSMPWEPRRGSPCAT